MDQITVLLLTYNRLDYAMATLRSTLDNLKTNHPLAVHIADDGSGKAYTDKLRELAGGYPNITGVTVTDSERGGYGRNYNIATQLIHQHSRYCLPIEDDWELTKEFNIDPLLKTLDEAPNIGCIRLGYVGYTQLLFGHLEFWNGSHYLVFNADSPERHVLAGHPRLEAVAWEQQVGPWVEGEAPGDTEFAVCGIPAARQRVAWPLDLVPPNGGLFAHIGARRSY